MPKLGLPLSELGNSAESELITTYDAQIRHGRTIDMARTQVLHVKNEVSDTI